MHTPLNGFTGFGRSFTPDLRKYVWFEGASDSGTNADITNATTTTTTQTDKQFTQADLDKYAGSARSDGRKAAVNDLLKELGLEKTEDLKALVKTVHDQQEAAKSDLEKAQSAKTTAEQERDTLKADLEAERLARRIDRRDTAIQQAALTGKDDKGAALPPAIDVQSVLEWARRDGNKALLDSTLNDDGTVNDKGVKALVDKARKDAGHLFAQPENRRIGTPSHNGGRITSKEPPKVQTSGRL